LTGTAPPSRCHYRHRETGAPFESTKANFWTLEDGWPVKLTEYHDIARVQAFVAANAGAHPA
jgi:ketosteroid isomerase-like protein